jgi:hypothetical protein
MITCDDVVARDIRLYVYKSRTVERVFRKYELFDVTRQNTQSAFWVRILVFTANTMKFYSFIGYSLVEVGRRFIRLYCFLHQGDEEAASAAYSSPWWCRQYAPLKRRFTLARLNGAVSKKAVIFTRFETFVYTVHSLPFQSLVYWTPHRLSVDWNRTKLEQC